MSLLFGYKKRRAKEAENTRKLADAYIAYIDARVAADTGRSDTPGATPKSGNQGH